MKRSTDRLLELAMLIVGIACFAKLYQVMGGKPLATTRLDTGAEIAEFDPGTGPMYSVAFAADGTLLTGGIDRTIRDWPAAGGDGKVPFAGAPE